MKHFEVFVLPGDPQGSPFTGRWIEVNAKNRKEAKLEAARIQGVNIVWVRSIRESREEGK